MTRSEAVHKALEAVEEKAGGPNHATMERRIARATVAVLETLGLITFDEEQSLGPLRYVVPTGSEPLYAQSFGAAGFSVERPRPGGPISDRTDRTRPWARFHGRPSG